MDWFVNNGNGNVIFVKGIDELSKLNNEQLEKFKINDINTYERLGADNMFGDNVKWRDFKNLLDYGFVNMNKDSKSFMSEQGYSKAERVRVEETKIEIRTYGYKDESGPIYNINQINDANITYVLPERLNEISNIDNPRPIFHAGTKISKYSYDLIKPYGEKLESRYYSSPLKTLYKKIKNITTK